MFIVHAQPHPTTFCTYAGGAPACQTHSESGIKSRDENTTATATASSTALKQGKAELELLVNSNFNVAKKPELDGTLLKYNSNLAIPVAAEQTNEQKDGTTENANEGPLLGPKRTSSSSSYAACARGPAVTCVR